MAAKFLYINTRDELVRLDCSKIVYMEGDGNYTNIILINKQKTSVCMNLSEMQRLISDSLKEHASIFIRVGKRFIVNREYIYKIQPLRKSLIVTDGINFTFQLGISKVALLNLKELFLQALKSNNSTENKQ